jgi:hypothetical protein
MIIQRRIKSQNDDTVIRREDITLGADTSVLLGKDIYNYALAYYRNIKLISQENVPGTTEVYATWQHRSQMLINPLQTLLRVFYEWGLETGVIVQAVSLRQPSLGHHPGYSLTGQRARGANVFFHQRHITDEADPQGNETEINFLLFCPMIPSAVVDL